VDQRIERLTLIAGCVAGTDVVEFAAASQAQVNKSGRALLDRHTKQ
jgi:hypothetical protein